MMIRFSGIWGVAAAALLTLPLSAQLTIRGSMIKVHESKPGRTIKAEMIIENSTMRVQGASLKLDPIKNDRDLSKYLTIQDTHFNIQARSAVKIKYTIRVPDSATGSYFVKFILTPAAAKKVGMVSVRMRLAGYILLDTPGGKTGFEFLDMKFENDSFLVDVMNTGTLTLYPQLTLYAGGKPYAAEARFCFPGQVVSWEISAPDLIPGHHSIIAIAQGKRASFGTRWDVDTGLEIIKEMTWFVPVRFRFGSDIGPEGTRSRVNASAAFGRWSFGTGGYFGQRSSRINFNLGHTTRRLAINAYAYSSNGEWRTSLAATLNLKKWLISLHSTAFETGNLELRYKLNRGYLGARATVRPGRFDWQLSASIPFEFQLKFKRQIKRERAKLETIIFEAKETN